MGDKLQPGEQSSVGPSASMGNRREVDARDIASETERVKLRAHRKSRAHYLTAKRCERMHTAFGVPVVIASTVVGSAIFATIARKPELIWQAVAGAVTIASAVLAALQTFFRFAESAAKHRQSGASYAALYRDLRLLRARANNSIEKDVPRLLAELTSIVHKYNDLEAHSLDVPDMLYDQAVREQSSDVEGV